MSERNKEIDIATNIKIVEWLKTELLDSVAALFKSLIKSSNDATNDTLATIIIISYLLGRRVGVSFQSIDIALKNKLENSIYGAHEIEQWYGDLSELQNYLEKKENKKR